MNFSGISSKTLLGRLLRLPLGAIPNDAILPVLQGKLRGRRWVVGSSNHGCWLGSFEYSQRVRFEQHVDQGDVVFDIGANVGFYTLLASILVGSGGKVLAFEPLPENLVYLKRHISMNQASNVEIIEAAVVAEAGSAKFQPGCNRSMGRVGKEGSMDVRTAKLDLLVAAGEVPAPDVIKIDIEGGEQLALQGAEHILKTCSPTLFLSTHGEAIHQWCCRFLARFDYEIEPLDGRDLASSREIIGLPRSSGHQPDAAVPAK